MKKNTLTIVLTGGGSGGHITPLLALARELKDKDPECQVVYMGLKGEKLEGLQDRYQVFDEVRTVPAGKFRRYHGESFLAHLTDIKSLVLNGRDFFRVLRGIANARRQLKQLRPDLVFSKGSYVAVPVGIAAHRLGIPIITHDSDAVPGLANRIIGRWAAIHAVGQPPENYNYPKDSLRFTGIPVDERVKEVTPATEAAFKTELGLPVDSLVLLVAGGGLGSGSLNGLIAQITPQLLKVLPKLCITVIAGQQHQAEMEKFYANLPEAAGRLRVIGFTPDFYRFSGAADLILCRAGASTLAEFAIQRKACVVVPAAQLSGGHQLANAKQLEKLYAAEIVPGNVEPAKLLIILEKLLSDKSQRQALASKLATLAKPKAAEELADLILTAAGAAI